MLRFVDGEEVRTDTLRELECVSGTCGKPGVKEGSEAALPGRYVRKAASIDEVRDEARGELENIFE